MSFWTGQELVDYLNEDSSSDSKLEDLEQRVVAAIEQATGRRLSKTGAVIDLQQVGHRQQSIFVANPISTLTQVRIGTQPGDGFSGLGVVALNGFGVGFGAGLAENEVLRLDGFFSPLAWVELTYPAGFTSSADAPGGLLQDILDIVANSWRARVTADGPADESGERAIGIPPQVVRRHMMPSGL